MRKKGISEEDKMHKSFCNLVKGYEAIGKLNSAWWGYNAAGEKRTLITGALLKSKGLKRGEPDYMFKTIRQYPIEIKPQEKLKIAHHIYIEFKTPTGKQSEFQKIFEYSCRSDNEKYYLARSVEQAISILEKENIILI